MSTRFSEWASKVESDRHFVSEGITQQPGSFYNGNFSSSIWGNPPTPPLWRDIPPPSYGSCSKEHGQQASVRPSFDQHNMEPVTLSQFQPPGEQGESVSNWPGSFSAGLQSGLQELRSSPFAFGFPAPQSAPSSSYGCTEGMQACPHGHRSSLNGSSTTFDKKSHQVSAKERALSLEELSNSWAAMLQSQAELSGSLDRPSTHSLAMDQASAIGVQEPIQCGLDNPFADAHMHGTSLGDPQLSELGGPDLTKSETKPFMSSKKDGTFVFSSSALGTSAKFGTSPLLNKKIDVGTFNFGAFPASETSVNVGFSQPKGFHASASGSKLKSSVASTKVRKHINVSKRGNSVAPPMSRDYQPVPSQCGMSSPFSSSTFLKFTMGASDADCVQNLASQPGFQERRNAGSVGDLSCENPFLFQGAASLINKDRDSTATLNVKGQNIGSQHAKGQKFESQHAQPFGNQSSAWRPFPMREETYLDNRNFVGVASSERTLHSNSFDRQHETRETSTEAVFLQEPSMETNKTFQESKLTEFDLNSPCKLSAEDLRERAVKVGKFGEEIKRQKENQEPNFSFGSQKGSKPFVFGSSRTTCSTKHTAANMDAMIKNGRFSKESKDNKALEHLIAKLGEKMANLGKSHVNLTNQETFFQRGEKVSASDCSSSNFHKGQEKKSVVTCSSEDAANLFEKCDTLDCSINELGEKFSELVTLGEKKSRIDKTGSLSHFSNGTTNGNAVEHAIRELREQISKLGPFDDIKTKKLSKEETARCSAGGAQYRGNSILRAVEELSEEIARLGTDKTADEHSNCKVQQCHTFAQSVEELRERLKGLGNANEKGENCKFESKLQDHKGVAQEAFVFTACPATAPKDSDSTRFKAFPNHSGGSSIGRAQFNPFINANSTSLFPSNEAQASSSFPMANPFTAGQPSSIQDAYSGINMFSFKKPAAGNSGQGGTSFGGFEFQGSKGPLKETSMQRRSGRACPNSKNREKAKLAGARRSAHFTSMSHNPGSPMDFSPCADKAAPSSSVSASGETGHEFVQTSPESDLDEVESMNVEDIRIATANLTVESGKEDSKGDQTGSGLSGRSSIETNPFVLREKKGTWKRAPNKGTNVSASTKGLWSQMAYPGSCGIGRGAESSFLPSGLPNGIGGREKSQRHTTRNSSSAYSFNEVEKGTFKAASERIVFPRKFDEFDKKQQTSSIVRETAATSTATKNVAAEQTCENWRLRGNQAYAKGDYEKAEDYYTRGVGSVLPGDMPESCIRASMLCYSNRAATRMAVGRMREALADCKQAMLLDSSFLRVRLRAASCHLALGESKAAVALFTECWSLAKERHSDFKIVDDAMEGVRKSQSFDNLLERASALLQTDASAALQFIDEALKISPFSEAIQGLKAQALFLLRRFEDVMELCEKTLPSAKENYGAHHHDESHKENGVFLNLWRWRMCGKSLFQMGKLEESLSLLTKYEEATSGPPSDEGANIESMATTAILIRDLLRHKAAGNEAFQAGRHAEALEHYTAALSCNSESRPYNAVCFCNRAAASQALDNIADAIADCSRAIVLDPYYAKAISRRATLHEIIRDFGQSCNDLQRLITLLEGQESVSKSLKMIRAASKNAQDIRQARERLEKASKEMKKDTVVDHYLILGLDVSCSPSDIKKAYRKAALKHHPDKAGQFLVRGENGDDGGLWKEVGDEVRKDAERLFKLIGEAYGILSDPTKRAQYDLEHHMSKGRNSTYQGYSNTEDLYEKASHRYQDRKDSWSGHSPRYQRWQNGPDAAQRDTYSERGTSESSRTRDRRQRGRRSDYYSWDEYY